MISNYKVFYELSKWKTQNLSNKSLIQLTKFGIRKPFTSYLDGINRGIDNKLKGIYQREDWNLPYTYDNKFITVDKKRRDTNFIARDHESNEKVLSNKLKNGQNLTIGGIRFFDKRKTGYATHSSPIVLKKENDLVNRLLRMYPHLKNHNDVGKRVEWRNDSGENDYINTKSELQLRKIDRKRSKDLRNFLKSIEKNDIKYKNNPESPYHNWREKQIKDKTERIIEL